jgi:hypothetical protein
MNTNNVVSLRAGEDVGIHLRVKVGTGGLLEVADAAEAAEVIGHNAYAPIDYDQAGRDTAAVQIKNGGILYAVAAGVIAVGAKFKGADGGKIQDHGGSGTAEGVVLQAAAADGDIIQVIYF